jgi:Tfp pilus assembly protein PilV
MRGFEFLLQSSSRELDVGARAVRKRLRMHWPGRRASASESGVSLILVLLALLILSVLAAAIVFTARSEAYASHNYMLNTEADYLAKAGIQQALNWFRSGRYQAVSQGQAGTYYKVSSDGSTYNLFTANTSPVQCVSGCTSLNTPVQLIGYGSGSSNYPSISNGGGTAVAAAFSSDLVNVRLTGDPDNSGTFSVNAVLLGYQTVNTGIPPALTTAPVETWLITSLGTWTGAASQSGVIATAEEQAIIQPIYTPTWGDAIYGYCSVTMSGSSGVCTDSFNSSFGQYGGGNKSVASGACDSSSTNVIASGAGVGANGSVILSSNVTVAGNVTIGTGAPPACGTGYDGSVSSVLGEVVNGPYKPPPAVPTFRVGFSGSAPSYSSSQNLPLSVIAWPSTFPAASYNVIPSISSTPPLPADGPCMDTTCNGSAANPFEISSINISSNSDAVQLIGGPDVSHPVYYDIDTLNESGKAQVNVSGYVVLNVRTSLSITGQGVTNGISGTVDIPPEAVQINYAGTTGVSLGGNGAISALVNAPNASVTLGGGGSKGYFVGAINAYNVSDQGGYPVHYDIQLNRLGGTMGVMVATAYSRKKM